MKSPLTIGYNDLISEQERQLAYMAKAYPRKVQQGCLNAHTARKRIECATVLIRLLKKHKKDPQLDLSAAFGQSHAVEVTLVVPPAPVQDLGDDPDFYLEGGG